MVGLCGCSAESLIDELSESAVTRAESLQLPDEGYPEYDLNKPVLVGNFVPEDPKNPRAYVDLNWTMVQHLEPLNTGFQVHRSFPGGTEFYSIYAYMKAPVQPIRITILQ